jgi:hypothetical protein
MKRRTTLYVFLSALFALFMIACATALRTGYSSNPATWLLAHKVSPLLWLLDFCVVYTLILMARLIASEKYVTHQASALRRLQEEHHAQLEQMIAQSEELEKRNHDYEQQIVALEEASAARQEAFETEARRLTEQAFRALQGQVEAHTRQLEAVTMAMQYHRAEIKQIRHSLGAVQPGDELPVGLPAAESPAFAAVSPPPSIEGNGANAEADLPAFLLKTSWHKETANAPAENGNGTAAVEARPRAVTVEAESVSPGVVLEDNGASPAPEETVESEAITPNAAWRVHV